MPTILPHSSPSEVRASRWHIRNADSVGHGRPAASGLSLIPKTCEVILPIPGLI